MALLYNAAYPVYGYSTLAYNAWYW